ncbi:hypothetical protein [uncultured Roseibium sp.]|uniref:hypothetical protein n=1 Tax=uncultured Roseibium sp. TaxID=1936171 RepID=UPI00262A574C|nr:hypothetical protein [uncultured Roseibium sp.]
MSRLKKLAFSLTFLLFGATSANAVTTSVGNPTSTSCIYRCMETTQQIYSSTYFGGGVVDITSIGNFAWRGDMSGTFDVYVSTSKTRYTDIPSDVFTDFTANHGSDYSYFGSVDLSDAKADFDVVTANGNFTYDSSAGDLLVEWVLKSDDSYSGGFLGGGLRAGTGLYSVAHQWRQGFGGNARRSVNGYGLATEFTYEATVSEVPLPASGLMLAGGLFLLVARSRQKAPKI